MIDWKIDQRLDDGFRARGNSALAGEEGITRLDGNCRGSPACRIF